MISVYKRADIEHGVCSYEILYQPIDNRMKIAWNKLISIKNAHTMKFLVVIRKCHNLKETVIRG